MAGLAEITSFPSSHWVLPKQALDLPLLRVGSQTSVQLGLLQILPKELPVNCALFANNVEQGWC